MNNTNKDKEILELLQDDTAYGCIQDALDQFYSHLNLISHEPRFDTHDLLNSVDIYKAATLELIRTFHRED